NYRGYNLVIDSIKELEGESVTISFEARSLDGDNDIVRVYWRGGSSTHYIENVPITSSWKRYVVYSKITQNVANSNSNQIAFHTNSTGGSPTPTKFKGEFKNVQVELGNKATAYRQAPEDMDARMTATETRITQLP